MNKVEEIKAEFRASLSEYGKVYAEAMYYEMQYNFPVTEEQRTHARKYNLTLHHEASDLCRAAEEAMFHKYADTEFEAAYDEASDDFGMIIREIQHAACVNAEQLMTLNSIEITANDLPDTFTREQITAAVLVILAKQRKTCDIRDALNEDDSIQIDEYLEKMRYQSGVFDGLEMAYKILDSLLDP